VRDDDDARPLVARQAHEEIHDVFAGEGVERPRRLGEDDLRPVDEGARHSDPLALVTRELAGPLPGDLTEVEAREPAPGLCKRRPRPAPPSIIGRAMFSAAVSSGTSWPNWNTKPNDVRRSRLRSASPSESMRRPSNTTSPPSGRRIPAAQ
jgi:hypothetical protein